MLFLGKIEPVSVSSEINPDKWLALIDSHQSLGHIPSRMGINPFTRQPLEYKASTDTAAIQINSAPVGTIHWAMAGSPFLIVWAEEESAESVACVAEDIATSLGARFVREATEE